MPEIDDAYRFNREVTLAILAGFMHNRRVLVQGLHGTGKSTHIEQVAARLNWPCVRVNLDGHVSRLDLVGREYGIDLPLRECEIHAACRQQVELIVGDVCLVCQRMVFGIFAQKCTV